MSNVFIANFVGYRQFPLQKKVCISAVSRETQHGTQYCRRTVDI